MKILLWGNILLNSWRFTVNCSVTGSQVSLGIWVSFTGEDVDYDILVCDAVQSCWWLPQKTITSQPRIPHLTGLIRFTVKVIGHTFLKNGVLRCSCTTNTPFDVRYQCLIPCRYPAPQKGGTSSTSYRPSNPSQPTLPQSYPQDYNPQQSSFPPPRFTTAQQQPPTTVNPYSKSASYSRPPSQPGYQWGGTSYPNGREAHCYDSWHSKVLSKCLVICLYFNAVYLVWWNSFCIQDLYCSSLLCSRKMRDCHSVPEAKFIIEFVDTDHYTTCEFYAYKVHLIL
jgi:hypothetical protein